MRYVKCWSAANIAARTAHIGISTDIFDSSDDTIVASAGRAASSTV
jgi:hypothetical protein